MLIQAFFKEFLSKNTDLWEAIHAFLNFDVDKSVGGDLVDKVVQYYEILGEILEFCVHVLRECHGCHEVKILEDNSAVACTLG